MFTEGFSVLGIDLETSDQNRSYLMKRMMFIVITLCLLSLLVAGAGAVVPQQKLPPLYRVGAVRCDLHNEVVGKPSVNTNTWTYVPNAQGLEPASETTSGLKSPTSALKTAKENGDLHMQDK